MSSTNPDRGGGGGDDVFPDNPDPGDTGIDASNYILTWNMLGGELHLPNLVKILATVFSGLILLLFWLPIRGINTLADIITDIWDSWFTHLSETLVLFWESPTDAIETAGDTAAASIADPGGLYGFIFALVVVALFFMAVWWTIGRIALGIRGDGGAEQ